MKKRMVKQMLSVVLGGLVAMAGLGVVSANDTEPYIVRYVTPGSEWSGQDQVLEAINEKLKTDGFNIEIEFVRIPWDAWDQKTQLMIASGEDFGLLHVMQDLKQIGALYGQGAIIPLDDLFATGDYDDLKSKFGENVWGEVSSGGHILGVPAMSTANQGKTYGDITYRKDVADKLGLKEPTNVDELIEFAKALQTELEKESGKPVYAWGGTDRPAEWYLRSLEDDYFYVDTALSLVRVDQDGTVSSYIESEEFKESCEIYEKLNAEGLIHPDILSLGREYGSNEILEGRWAIGFDSGTPFENELRVKQNVPGASIGVFQLKPEKADFITFYTYNCNAIPSTCSNPKASLDFMQWLYSSKENHDLFMYGIDGVTYDAIDEDKMNTYLADDGNPVYKYDEWQIAYQPYRRYVSEMPEELIALDQRRRDLDTEAVVSVATGFMFDSSPIADIAANLSAEAETVLAPLKCGLISYDEGFENALEQLKAAGLDEYIAEFDRQFQEYYAAKSK